MKHTASSIIGTLAALMLLCFPLRTAAAQQHLTTAQQHLTTAQQHLTTAQQHLTTPEASIRYPKFSGAPGSGATLELSEDFSLNVRSRFQLRYQLTIPPKDAAGDRKLAQTVNINALRLSFSGHLYDPKFTYLIQLALAAREYKDSAVSPIYDAYVDWKATRDLSLRAGQFFVPFDRLRTVRDGALQVTDRPRPVTQFTLDRDAGVVLYSDKFLGDHSPVAYRLGVFGGNGPNAVEGKEPGALVVARVELRPLGAIDDDMEGDLDRRAEPGLAIGAAAAVNRNSNRFLSTTGTTFTGGTVDYTHAAADLVFKWHGAALQAEYLVKSASRRTILSTDAETGEAITEATHAGSGWVLQGSYALNPLEFVGRYSRLYAATGTAPAFQRDVRNLANEFGGGVNYYVNKHRFKLQASWTARLPANFEFKRAAHAATALADVTF